MKYFKSISLILFLISSLTIAQENEDDKLSLDEGPLESQFEYVLKKSGNFKGMNGQQYEAVKLSHLITLKAHVLDSLKTIQEKLDKSNNTVAIQEKEISDLQKNLANTQTTLDNTNKEKDSMALFGIQMSKTNYNILLWSIIALLLALLVFFFYKFNNSNSITKQTRKVLAEIEEEFDEHRRTALEREQKVRRQLQDELNKQKSDS